MMNETPAKYFICLRN